MGDQTEMLDERETMKQPPQITPEQNMENEKAKILGPHFLARPLVVAIVGALVGATVGGYVSYLLVRPTPFANANCSPVTGSAPMTVKCTNLSQYARHIEWRFDGDIAEPLVDQNEAEFTYSIPKKYTIILNAHGHGYDDWTREVDVWRSKALSNPESLRIIASTISTTVTRTTTHPIDKTKDDHPSPFNSHSRNYTQRFSVEPGYTAIAAEFAGTSVNNASNIRTTPSSDGKTVLVSFALKSGPAVDRWRGWIHGKLKVTEQREIPSTQIDLGEIIVAEEGLYALTANIGQSSLRNVVITDEDGTVIVSGPPGETLINEAKNLRLEILEDDGRLSLRVQRVTEQA